MGASFSCETLRRKSLNRYIVKAESRPPIYESRTSFGFADLMLQCNYFVLHLAHFHTRDCTAPLVKQLNERAWRAADVNDEETERADQTGFCLPHPAKAAKHDL